MAPSIENTNANTLYQDASTGEKDSKDTIVDLAPQSDGHANGHESKVRWDGLIDNAVTREQAVLSYNPNPNRSVMDMFSMAGKVGAVTGGTRGIGYAAAEALAEAGCHLALIYVSTPPKKAKAIADGLAEKHGVKVRTYQADVADSDSINKSLAAILKDFGHIHVVIANAGIGTHLSCLDIPVEIFLREQAVNFHGAFFTAQSAGRIFKQQGFGNLIFTASMSGSIVNLPQSQASYNSSKAAVIHLAKSLAVEWMDFARVNCVSPGYFYTDMVTTLDPTLTDAWKGFSPAQRFGNVGELKGAYLYLASDASSFTTGLDMMVDGGYALV